MPARTRCRSSRCRPTRHASIPVTCTLGHVGGIGGAAVGAPLDSMGALTWNPATISALPQSEMGFSAAMILPNMKINTPYGEVNGQPGVAVAPNFGIVSKNPCSRWTFGLGLSTLGGAKAAYPSLKQIAGPDPTVSALSTLNADIMMLQFAPTASYQLTGLLICL